jgi:hypothetical protein
MLPDQRQDYSQDSPVIREADILKANNVTSCTAPFEFVAKQARLEMFLDRARGTKGTKKDRGIVLRPL